MYKINRQLKRQNLTKLQEHASRMEIEPTKKHVELKLANP